MIAQGRGGRIIGAHDPVLFSFSLTVTRGYSRGKFIGGKTGSFLSPFALWLDETYIVVQTQPIPSSRRTAQASLLFAVSPKRLARTLTELHASHSLAETG